MICIYFWNLLAFTLFGNYEQFMYMDSMVLALAASFPARYGIQQLCYRRWKQGSKQQDSILLINLHILHIILKSFNRNNTNATLYNNRVSPLKYYYILFISVYPLDLLQVDLLASGASLVWQRSGRPRAIRRRTFGKSMHPYMCYFADKIS